MHFVTLHALKPYPDVGLDIFHDMADMKRAVGIRQGGRYEKLAGLWDAHRVVHW
jgi:hypothetical protein